MDGGEPEKRRWDDSLMNVLHWRTKSVAEAHVMMGAPKWLL
jgi:hypothetical protein